MNKVQFFYDSDLDRLQTKINDWLADNKDAHIADTNLNSLGKPGNDTRDEETKQYVFYILYTADKYEAAAAITIAKEQLTPVEQLVSNINDAPAVAN